MSSSSLACVIGVLSLLHRVMLAAYAKLKLLSQMLVTRQGWQCQGSVGSVERIAKPIQGERAKTGVIGGSSGPGLSLS